MENSFQMIKLEQMIYLKKDHDVSNLKVDKRIIQLVFRGKGNSYIKIKGVDFNVPVAYFGLVKNPKGKVNLTGLVLDSNSILRVAESIKGFLGYTDKIK